MELKSNQAALIHEDSEDGEITVNVESPDLDGWAGAFCQAIAKKLIMDEDFRTELQEMVEETE